LANEEKTDEEPEGTEEETSDEPEGAAEESTEDEEGTADESAEDDEALDDDDEALDDDDEALDDDDEALDDDDEASDGDEALDDDDEALDDDDEALDDDDDSKASGAKKSSSSTRRKKKTGRKKKKPKTTAGQRLAAAKAAKAARKAAQRGKDAEKVEDKATEQAEAASRWLEENRQKLLMLVAAIVLIGAGIFAFQRFARAGDAEAAGALWDAMEVANARIVDPELEEEAADDDAEDEEEVTFESERARAEAAVEAFEEVIATHGGTKAAAFARIGLGNAQRVLGDAGAARESYEAALAESDDPEVALRSLEGIGFTHEVDEAWDEAEARFEEMGDIDRPGAEILADYHLARIALAKDETERAKEKLQALLESLDEEDAPQMEFVRDQAEMRLREIDPSLVQSSAPSMIPGMGGPGGMPGAGGLGGAGGEGMTPEMQRMLEELMRKQGQQQGQ